MQSWFDMLRAATVRGRRFARVRVVTTPLTDYSRFGLWCAQFTNATGEDIRYLQRDEADRQDLPSHDYWLFDSRKLVRMHFDRSDVFLGGEVVEEPAVIVEHIYWRDAALHHAARRDDFATRQGVGRIERPCGTPSARQTTPRATRTRRIQRQAARRVVEMAALEGSKLENGRQTPTDQDIRAWTHATGSEGETAALLASLHTLEVQHDAVHGRLRRQEILYRPGKRFHFVLAEAALRFRLCSSQAMLGQRDRLVSLSHLPNVKLGVMGFDAQYATSPRHGFWLYDDQKVLVETMSAALDLRQPQEIELYSDAFDQLAAVASYGRSARAIITRAMDDFASRADGS